MRILLVEDETKLATALAEGLTHQGFTVDTLEDGEAAYTRILLYRNDYDLILLDLMLPGMDGREICEKVRAEGVKTPILILTARSEGKRLGRPKGSLSTVTKLTGKDELIKEYLDCKRKFIFQTA